MMLKKVLLIVSIAIFGNTFAASPSVYCKVFLKGYGNGTTEVGIQDLQRETHKILAEDIYQKSVDDTALPKLRGTADQSAYPRKDDKTYKTALHTDLSRHSRTGIYVTYDKTGKATLKNREFFKKTVPLHTTLIYNDSAAKGIGGTARNLSDVKNALLGAAAAPTNTTVEEDVKKAFQELLHINTPFTIAGFEILGGNKVNSAGFYNKFFVAKLEYKNKSSVLNKRKKEASTDPLHLSLAQFVYHQTDAAKRTREFGQLVQKMNGAFQRKKMRIKEDPNNTGKAEVRCDLQA